MTRTNSKIPNKSAKPKHIETIKCNRTVCVNQGEHKHNFNQKLYCMDCVKLIEVNVILFDDPRCFDEELLTKQDLLNLHEKEWNKRYV